MGGKKGRGRWREGGRGGKKGVGDWWQVAGDEEEIAAGGERRPALRAADRARCEEG